MNHILRAMEWLLGAIEHRAYVLRVRLYYRRTGIIPPGALIPIAGNGGYLPSCGISRDIRVDAAVAYATRMGEIAAASLAASARIAQAGDTP